MTSSSPARRNRFRDGSALGWAGLGWVGLAAAAVRASARAQVVPADRLEPPPALQQRWGVFGAAVLFAELDPLLPGQELIVGQPGAEFYTISQYPFAGRVLIHNRSWLPNVAILDAGAGAQNGAEFGMSLAVGYINGDDHIDVVVGQPKWKDPQNVRTGRVHVFYGPWNLTLAPPNLGGTDVVPYPGTPPVNARFGQRIVCRDVDSHVFGGDDRDEIIAGAPDFNAQTGEAWIVKFGSMSAGSQRLESKEPDGDAWYGWDVTTGNFRAYYDPDRVDIVIGEFNYPGGAGAGSEVGRLTAHFDGRWNQAEAILIPNPNPAAKTMERFSLSLAVADYDQDGDDDLVGGGPTGESIHEIDQNPSGREHGSAYLLDGGAFFGSASPPYRAFEAVGPVSFPPPINAFGIDCAFGHLTGDNWIDLVIGAQGANKVYVFYGSDPATSTPFSTFLVLQDPTPEGGARYGWALSVGNWDGMLSGDIAIGCPLATVPNPGGTESVGDVWVVR